MATVSRVVNGVSNKASPTTTERVLAAIAELGYRPLSSASSLRRGRSRLVAVLAANLANPSMAAMAASIEVALRDAGYVMVLCDTHDRAELQDEYLLEMRAQQACSIVLLGAVDSPALRAFSQAAELPLVFVNRRSPVGQGSFVGIDNQAAGAEVAQWFASMGWRRVALIHGQLFSSATALRVQGFCDAVRERGLLLPASRRLGATAADHLEIGRQAAQRLLAKGQPPQAVFCTSDLIAYGAQRAAAERGLVAGRDIHWVGFDDSPLNEWVAPWLNAVRVPYADYGEAVLGAIRGERSDVLLAHRLVQRLPAR